MYFGNDSKCEQVRCCLHQLYLPLFRGVKLIMDLKNTLKYFTVNSGHKRKWPRLFFFFQAYS